MDVGMAGVTVRLLPALLSKFIALDPTLFVVAGAGGTYLVGSMMKKPDLANAGIALGLVELVAPMIENLIGGIGGTPITQTSTGGKGTVWSGAGGQGTSIPWAGGGRYLGPPYRQPKGSGQELTDYITLNDYITNPSVRQGINQYNSSY